MAFNDNSRIISPAITRYCLSLIDDLGPFMTNLKHVTGRETRAPLPSDLVTNPHISIIRLLVVASYDAADASASKSRNGRPLGSSYGACGFPAFQRVE